MTYKCVIYFSRFQYLITIYAWIEVHFAHEVGYISLCESILKTLGIRNATIVQTEKDSNIENYAKHCLLFEKSYHSQKSTCFQSCLFHSTTLAIQFTMTNYTNIGTTYQYIITSWHVLPEFF